MQKDDHSVGAEKETVKLPKTANRDRDFIEAEVSTIRRGEDEGGYPYSANLERHGFEETNSAIGRKMIKH